VAQLGSDFIIGFPVVTVGGCEAFQVRHVPYNNVGHAMQNATV